MHIVNAPLNDSSVRAGDAFAKRNRTFAIVNPQREDCLVDMDVVKQMKGSIGRERVLRQSVQVAYLPGQRDLLTSSISGCREDVEAGQGLSVLQLSAF